MDKMYVIGAGIAFFFLRGKSSGGNHKPPNERWFDVPGVGITPEGMLLSVGYVYMPEIEGYVSRAELITNGWILTNGVWDLPQGASAGDYLVLAGSLLEMIPEDTVDGIIDFLDK